MRYERKQDRRARIPYRPRASPLQAYRVEYIPLIKAIGSRPYCPYSHGAGSVSVRCTDTACFANISQVSAGNHVDLPLLFPIGSVLVYKYTTRPNSATGFKE